MTNRSQEYKFKFHWNNHLSKFYLCPDQIAYYQGLFFLKTGVKIGISIFNKGNKYLMHAFFNLFTFFIK